MPPDHNCSQLAVWEQYVKTNQPAKKSFFKKKEVSVAQHYLQTQSQISETVTSKRKRGKATKLIALVLSGAVGVALLFYFSPTLLNFLKIVGGGGQTTWGQYSVPAYPGAMGINFSDNALVPAGANGACYVVQKSSDEVVQWYYSQMHSWTKEKENSLKLEGLAYDYVCWKKENAGAMIYTTDMGGQTTIITAVGPWTAFQGYTPLFITNQEEGQTTDQPDTHDPNEPQYPE